MAISDCTRLWEGNREGFGATRSRAGENYTCGWLNRITSKIQFVGRIHSDYSWMICTDVDITPFGDADSDTGGPKTALLTVEYKDRSSAEDAGEALEETGQSDAFDPVNGWKERWVASGEAITVGTGFKWSDTGEKIKSVDDVSAVKIFPTANIMLSGQTARVNSNAKNLMLNAIGKLNTKTISIRGYAYSDGHLLFLAPELDEGKDSIGNRTDGISYNFAYRHDASWNHFWRPDVQTFSKIIGTDSNLPPYSDVQFSDLNPSNW